MTGERRRRRVAEAEREILDSAERFLRSHPLRDLTIDKVMAGTSLSRPAFYGYVRNRHDLVLRVIEELGAELWGLADRWLTGDDARQALRSAIERIVAAHARHGAVIRAIADASADDESVEAAYRERVELLIAATERHIRAQTRAGFIGGLNAKRTAAALVWMNERYLSICMGRQPKLRPREAAESLHRIWLRTLYLEDTA